MNDITPQSIFEIADYCLLEYQKKQLIIMLTNSMLTDLSQINTNK